MAAGWLRHLAGDRVAVFSAGSEPAEAINHTAVEVMAEQGIDIAGQAPRRWDDDMVRTADVVVTMGCGDTCPYFAGKRYVDWKVDDPAGLGVDQVREIRDELEGRVRGLIEELEVSR